MSVIDDEGNLFGVVNVVDALVVVLAIAILVAGAALAGAIGDGGSETADDHDVRYVTVDLGEQPEFVIDRVAEGDRIETDGGNLTITDVHPTPMGEVSGDRLFIRAELEGEAEERNDATGFEFDGEPVRVGQEFTIDTLEYAATGVVTSVDAEPETLPTDRTEVLVETVVSATTAAEIREGDEAMIGPHTVATVESVTPYPTPERTVSDDPEAHSRAVRDERRVHVGIALSTMDRGSSPTFGGHGVSVGSGVHLAMPNYAFEGEVRRVDSFEESGTEATTTAEVELQNVEASVAESLAEGQTETIRGETYATIQSVESEPATVFVESDDGTVHESEHPQHRDVTLEVELRTYETDTTVRFHGESLEEGDRIVLQLDSRTIEGEVTSLE